MKNKRKLLIISSVIILSLSLLAACKADNSPAVAIESPGKASKVEEPQTQPQEQTQKEPKEQPVAEVPADTKPEEPPKPTEAVPKKSEEPAEKANNDEASFQIEGSAVEKSIVLTLDDLKAMKDAYLEDEFFSLNSYGTKEYFSFKGVKLSAILQKAGLKKNAAIVTLVASDGYEQEITIEQALKEDYIDEQNPDKRYPVIIAWNENNQDYDVSKGAPFRLVIGQKEPGDVNKPQWVQNVVKIIVD